MGNLEKYNFSDFLLSNYRKILEIAKENYSFTDYFNSKNVKEIILRHDIEFSIPIALRMAEIENELDISSTYFIQLHSEFYNPFELENFESIMKIISLGHSIGLHFDVHFWKIKDENELEKYLEIDKSTLEKYFGQEIKVFSFHNTNDLVLSFEKEKYAGMLNVYSRYFKEEVGYCTDSTGYWRYERLEVRIKEAKDNKLQILIHDGMWQDEVLPPRRRIFKIIDERAKYLKKFYDDTLKKFGAKNIDWEEIL